MSPQKRTSSASKHEKILCFFLFVGHFALLNPDPDRATQINADPGPDSDQEPGFGSFVDPDPH